MVSRGFLPEAKKHGTPLVEDKRGTQLPVHNTIITSKYEAHEQCIEVSAK